MPVATGDADPTGAAGVTDGTAIDARGVVSGAALMAGTLLTPTPESPLPPHALRAEREE